ncbi:MAG: hypothetical protein U0936_01835 [Planctomycetaceae bacterium]
MSSICRVKFSGNVLMIRVRLKAAGAQGQQVTLRVFQENRNGLQDGQSGPMEAVPMTATEKSLVTVTPKESSEEQTVQLQITPQQFGDIKIAVEAEPIAQAVRAEQTIAWRPSFVFVAEGFEFVAILIPQDLSKGGF